MFQHHLLNTSNQEASYSYSSLVVVVFFNHHSHFPFPRAAQNSTQPFKWLNENISRHAAFKCECLLAECHIGVVLSLHFLFCGQRGQKDHAAAGCKPQSCLHWGWWDCGHGTNEGLGTRMRWGFGGWQGGTKLPEAFPCRLGSTHLKDPWWRVKSMTE